MAKLPPTTRDVVAVMAQPEKRLAHCDVTTTQLTGHLLRSRRSISGDVINKDGDFVELNELQ